MLEIYDASDRIWPRRYGLRCPGGQVRHNEINEALQALGKGQVIRSIIKF